MGYSWDISGVFTEYSWDISRVFTEYSWDIRMYRVCVGYVSGMCRNKQVASGVQKQQLAPGLEKVKLSHMPEQ